MGANITHSNNLELNESAINEIINDTNLEMQKILQSTLEPTIKELKVAALNYLATINSARERVKRIEDLLNHQKALRHSKPDTYEESKKYIDNKKKISNFLKGQQIKKLYKESFKFQEQVNKALGQNIKMMYVYENKGIPEIYEMKSEKFLKFGYSSSNKIKGYYEFTKKQLESRAFQKMEIADNVNFDLNNLNITYQEIVKRYQDNKKSKLYAITWEYPLKHWNIMNIASKGDINEAYASIVINNRAELTFKNDLEKNIDDFAKEISKVTNLSGLLQGDITLGDIEYGIKSAGAMTLGLNQIYLLAQEILLSTNYSIQDLKNKQQEFRDKERARNSIQQAFSQTALEALKQAMITS